MNHDDEIRALCDHFERRKLDQAEAANIVTTWLGITVGMASSDQEGIDKRVSVLLGWITDAARKITRSLNPSPERMQ